MRKGKIAAQASHASMKAILDLAHNNGSDLVINYSDNSVLDNWLNGIFTKVCVSVDSEQELIDIYETAKSKGMICSLIKDAGLTEFNGVPTLTCCAIGPDYEDKINEITGHLKLL